MDTIKKIIIIGATLCLGICVVQADASELFQSGFYAGGSLGASHLNTESESILSYSGKVMDRFNSKETNKFFHQLGAHVGYLQRIEETNWVFGPHLSLELGGHKATFCDTDLGVLKRNEIKMPASFALAMRGGYVFEESWFLYATLGAKKTKMMFSAREDGTLFGRDRKWVTGYLYGAGVEKQLPNGHRIGLEANQTYYGKRTFSVTDADGDSYTTQMKARVTGLNLTYSVPF